MRVLPDKTPPLMIHQNKLIHDHVETGVVRPSLGGSGVAENPIHVGEGGTDFFRFENHFSGRSRRGIRGEPIVFRRKAVNHFPVGAEAAARENHALFRVQISESASVVHPDPGYSAVRLKKCHRGGPRPDFRAKSGRPVTERPDIAFAVWHQGLWALGHSAP